MGQTSMPKTVTRRYTVWDGGQLREGSAREILERFKDSAGGKNADVRAMTVEEYARTLIEDAPYFVAEDLFKQLQGHEFASEYDKALACLAAGSRRIRILS